MFELVDEAAALAALPRVDALHGAELVEFLEATALDWRSDAFCVAYLQATERALAEIAALQQEALVRVAGLRRQETLVDLGHSAITIDDAVRSEVALALHWSESQAQRRIDAARIITDLLPSTSEHLSEGAISLPHALAIADAVERIAHGMHLDPVNHGNDEELRQVCIALEQRVLPVARRQPLAATRRCIERAVHALAADSAAERHAHARRSRNVWVRDCEDGVSLLCAVMDSVTAHACMHVLNESLALQDAANAHRPETDGRTRGERRSEALADALLGSTPGPAGQPPIAVQLDVVIDLDTLLGLRAGSATVDGTLVTSHDRVRELLMQAGDVTMRRLVTDPLTGALLDRGRTAYTVPDALRGFIIARDVRCRFPGCGRRAVNADIDHAIAWNDGGDTSAHNLGALCRRHHLIKTHAGYDLVDSSASGACTWRTPAGLEYEALAEAQSDTR